LQTCAGAISSEHVTTSPHRSELRIAFESPEHAVVAADSLRVDAELQPTKAVKTFHTDGAVVVA
jgi:hypothetical protein